MKALTIIVCIKTVPDPEGPASALEIHADTKTVTAVGIPPVINPFDENALELAVRLKDQWGGRVIAVSVAEKAAVSILRKALSVGADELVVLEDQDYKDLSSDGIAEVLSAAIRKMGEYDLILTGRQAADWDSGQVGLLVAEILQIPAVNLARRIEIENGRMIVEKLRRTGYEVVGAPMGTLVTVSSEAGELRLPTMKAIVDARKKPLTVWRAADLGIDGSHLKTRKIRSLSRPSSRARSCVFIEGKSSQEKGANLAQRLREDRMI